MTERKRPKIKLSDLEPSAQVKAHLRDFMDTYYQSFKETDKLVKYFFSKKNNRVRDRLLKQAIAIQENEQTIDDHFVATTIACLLADSLYSQNLIDILFAESNVMRIIGMEYLKTDLELTKMGIYSKSPNFVKPHRELQRFKKNWTPYLDLLKQGIEKAKKSVPISEEAKRMYGR